MTGLGKSLELGLHATTRGFSYVVFCSPLAPYDWGNIVVRGDKNAMSLRKLTKLLDRFSPETVVIETGDGKTGRHPRIERLHKSIASLCAARCIELAPYTFRDVKACFGSVGASTRQEIAEAVARSIDVLAPKLPKPRREWQSADRRMALFCAAALVLTHYQMGANRLFNELSQGD